MSKNITNAVVIGATGLIGRILVKRLIQLESCEKLLVITRREDKSLNSINKVQQLVIDDLLMINDQDVNGFSHAFSCLGSTIKKAGSKQNFYNIDFEINAHFADLFVETETHFLMISAEGADETSMIFYNQVKGKLENYVLDLDLKRVSILRPSLLLGERNEKRVLEDLSQKIFKAVSHFLPDTFRYKPVTAEQVAYTMVEIAQQQTENNRIYDNLAIQKYTTEG